MNIMSMQLSSLDSYMKEFGDSQIGGDVIPAYRPEALSERRNRSGCDQD